jgi:hypothetical protein
MLATVRDVTQVAQSCRVVEPGVVVHAGGVDRGVNADAIRTASRTSMSCPSPLPAAGPS